MKDLDTTYFSSLVTPSTVLSSTTESDNNSLVSKNLICFNIGTMKYETRCTETAVE
jgi:hypothetical protein